MDNQNLPGTVRQDVSVGEWIVTFIITAIPLVGLIMLFVWAFGDGTNPSKQNWARAYLILALIMIVLGIIFMILFYSFIASAFSGYSSYS